MTSIIGSCVARGIVVVSDTGETRGGSTFSTRDNKIKPIRLDGSIGYPANTEYNHDVVIQSSGFVCYAGNVTYGDGVIQEFSRHLRENPSDMDFDKGLEVLEAIYSSFAKQRGDFRPEFLLGGYSTGSEHFYLGTVVRDDSLPDNCRRASTPDRLAIGSKKDEAEKWVGRRLELRGDRGQLPLDVGARISLEAREEVSRNGGSAVGDVQLVYFNGSEIRSYHPDKGNLLFLAAQLGNPLLQEPVVSEDKVESVFKGVLERGLSAKDAFNTISTKTRSKMLREIAFKGGRYRTGLVERKSETL